MSLWTQVVFVFTIKPNITRENMHEYLTYDINFKKRQLPLYAQSTTVRYTLRRVVIVLGTFYLQSSYKRVCNITGEA